jgi:23S rRNA (uracil1939-C5)-methyltransferase
MARATVTVERMVVGGDAFGHLDDGRAVFVHGALPGETVGVEITSSKRDYAKGAAVRIVTPSPIRVEPPCEVWHRGCGGCDWQHVRADAQPDLKLDMVAEALRRTARLGGAVVTAGAGVGPWGYRTTVRAVRGPTGRWGFRGRRSHDVVEFDACPIAAPALNRALAASTATGERTVRVSRATGESTVAGERNERLVEVVAGARLRVSADSFFQSSPDAAEALVDAVGRALAATGVRLGECDVVDAYGGVGLFAATCLAGARSLLLIESSPSSCADARRNLAHLPATVVERRLEDWSPVRSDVIVADPARAGLGRVAAERLAATGAATFVLVSCDAGALGRDVRLLTDLGFRHVRTEVLDVFPQTSHVEAVTTMVR